MENIYKIKIRSPNPQEVYPSERRYSSSMVLGMSVMFLALALTSTLMGVLLVRKLSTPTITQNSTRLDQKIEQELDFLNIHHQKTLNLPVLVSAGCFLMSMGLMTSALSGLLAWKRWYIDRNITWFFAASCLSTVTGAVCLLLAALGLLELRRVSLGLAVNVLITAILATVWSSLAANVSFKGMKRDYPSEDGGARRTGAVQVNTVKKGNKIAQVDVPPDILDHFPGSGKLAKYFPRSHQKQQGANSTGDGLPKEESNKEYQERVRRFLTTQQEGNNNHDVIE